MKLPKLFMSLRKGPDCFIDRFSRSHLEMLVVSALLEIQEANSYKNILGCRIYNILIRVKTAQYENINMNRSQAQRFANWWDVIVVQSELIYS